MKLVVFTYAPAGLGHLRVTGALVGSKPKSLRYELLGSSDPFLTWIHRITSTNPLLRHVYESFQYGWLEDIFTLVFSWYLRKKSGKVKKRLLEIIDAHPEIDSILVVATHFGLAHQIGSIKALVKKKTGVKIDLVVQVTDDTSQHIWCVRGADITFVPSRLTRDNLALWAKKSHIKFNGEVSPYPVSPELCRNFDDLSTDRSTSLNVSSNDPINVMVPISGAAVGLPYLAKLLKSIDLGCSRFHFWVISKRSSQTKKFLAEIGRLRWVQLVTGRNDSEVVREYEKIYADNLIHLEITKPSEQSFKALIPPSMKGGSLLFFVKPIGRQEYDNLDFLERHSLVARKSLINKADDNYSPPRGIILSEDPEEASRSIILALENGFLHKMAAEFSYSPSSMMTGEVSEKGTWLFWEKLKLLGFI